MDFVGMTINALEVLAKLVGNWGVAIILLTIVIRMALWLPGVHQQRSMREMQKFQPRMKEIQERYKSNPEQMQKKITEFYKEHNFNPFGGCLPMLVQLPIFILLYSALISPQFIATAGDAHFLFVKRLDATIKSNAGISFDNSFGVEKGARFASGKTATVVLKTEKGEEETLENVKIDQPLKAVSVQGDITPGEPVDFKIPLDNLKLSFSQLDKIQQADFDIINTGTKETEKINFKRSGDNLIASVPTIEVKGSVHYDVIALVILFILTMFISQKVMTASSKNAPQDPMQEAMQKQMGTIMPIAIGATFLFIPIPAGVLLYLVTSNIFQVIQTLVINKQLDIQEAHKVAAEQTSDESEAVKKAKKIKVKE